MGCCEHWARGGRDATVGTPTYKALYAPTAKSVNFARLQLLFLLRLAGDSEDLANDFMQLLHVGRFAHKSVGTVSQDPSLRLDVDATAHHDDRDRAGKAGGLEFPKDFEAIASRHID